MHIDSWWSPWRLKANDKLLIAKLKIIFAYEFKEGANLSFFKYKAHSGIDLKFADFVSFLPGLDDKY